MEIKKQELKQILAEQRKEFQHYIGALMEDSNSKFELLAEQYFDIKKTQSSHTEMIASIKEDVEVMKVDIEVTKEDIQVTKEDIQVMKEDIQVMKEDISFIKAGLKQKVDIEEFGALERRVALLEAKAR